MKRFVSLVLTAILFVSCFGSLPVVAVTDGQEYVLGRSEYEACNETAVLALDYSEEGMKAYFLQELAKCNERIDVSAYNIPLTQENFSYLAGLIMYGIPEAFHVINVSCSSIENPIKELKINYACDAEQYSQLMIQTAAVANALIKDIQDTQLSDVEKALLIHDRLALVCTYDDNFASNDTLLCESYGIYGALVEGQAICQGYSRAYMYLLDLVGIESYLCTSDKLVHMWNIVCIDGKPYHVDVTWDDPSFGENSYNVAGYVEHHNFMLSTSAFYASGHDATDYDSAPSDTTYDNYCWQNSTTAFQLIDNEIYYLDNVNSKLMSFSDGGALLDVSHKWKANSYGYYNDNFTSLASDGENLLFSDSDSIYSYNVESGLKQKVFTAEVSPAELIFIYGIKYSNGYLEYDLSDSPVFDNPDSISRQRVQFDIIAPKISARVTNSADTKQTLRLSFSDNSGISGYYFGGNSVYTENIFVASEETTVDVAITESGNYYIAVVDDFGNVSDVLKAVFYKTELDPTGGEVAPEYIISCSGLELALPVPVKENSVFLGWSTDAKATEGVTTVTPTGNSVYYAIWKDTSLKVPVSAEIISLPAKTQYFEGESLDLSGLSIKVTMSDGSEETVTEGFTINGFDPAVTGQQTLTVEIYDFALDFEITVIKIEPVSLSVKTPPVKTAYFVGDTVDTTGLELGLTYNNGLTLMITEGYTVSDPVLDSSGDAAVEVEYEGFTASFIVQVAEPKLIGVEVFTTPQKTDYYIGESFDVTGFSLLLTYDNGEKVITDSGYIMSGYDAGVEGEQIITVEFEGFSANFKVNVKRPLAVSADIINLPDKMEYKVGEKLDLTGFDVKVVYENGAEIIYSDNFIVNDTIFTQAGDNVLTIRFDDCAVILKVKVTEDVISTEATEASTGVVPVITSPTEATEAVTDKVEQTTVADETEPTTSVVATDPSESVSTEIATDATESSTQQEETEISTDVSETSPTDTSEQTTETVEESTTASADESYIIGDANCDLKVNIKDATIIQKFIAKLLDLEPQGKISADVNSDGKINVKDVTTIQKFVAGIIDKFDR